MLVLAAKKRFSRSCDNLKAEISSNVRCLSLYRSLLQSESNWLMDAQIKNWQQFRTMQPINYLRGAISVGDIQSFLIIWNAGSDGMSI
jgi:hypothetical protein